MYLYREQMLSSVNLEVPTEDNIDGIDISFEMVTPVMAADWLNTNSDMQRKLNSNIVRQYESQMRKGLWRGDNGEAIKFSKDGLLDGQHRLHAIILLKKPVLMMVIRGLSDNNAIKTMDLGKKRSLGDILKVFGVETIPGMNENVLASVANGLYIAMQYMKVTRKDSISVRIDSTVKVRPTPLELYEFLQNNPQIIKRFEKLRDFKLPTMAKNVSLSPTLVAWFLVDVIDEEISEQILMTMQECVPQTVAGRSCAAFKVLQYIQRQKSKNVTINKHEYPGLWLWAADFMLREKLPSRLHVSSIHMPGQGHEGSVKLKKFFKSLNDLE
jgi:hypothetical protein